MSDSIKDNLRLKGILKSFSFRKKLKSIREVFFLGIIFAVLIHFNILTITSKNELLYYVIQLSKDILPNLIGFLLGGYALLIGFGNSNLLRFLSKKPKKESASFYQKLSGFFAWALIIHISTLTLSVLIDFILQFKIPLMLKVECAKDVIFIFLTFLIFLGLMYSIRLCYDIVVQIFNFGQVHHYILIKEKKKEEEKNLKILS